MSISVTNHAILRSKERIGWDKRKTISISRDLIKKYIKDGNIIKDSTLVPYLNNNRIFLVVIKDKAHYIVKTILVK